MSIVFPSSQDDLSDIAAQARRLADALDRLAADRRPSTPEMAGAPMLDAWSMGSRRVPALVGTVAGHRSIAEARLTITSELFAIDPRGRWARTWSRFYWLADPISSPARKWN